MPREDISLRVLLVIPLLGTAGAENQLAHLATGLARRGYEVTIAAMLGVGRDTEPLRRARVEVIDFGVKSRAGKIASLPKLIRLARRADVVHCGLWDATLWARLAAIAARRPVVVAEHSPGREVDRSRRGSPRGHWIAAHHRLLSPFTFATVACATWQVPLLEGEGVDPARIFHIPNGVPIDQLRAAARAGPSRAGLGIPGEALVVVHAARLEWQKNQRASIDTVARLREVLGDVRLLVVGGGSQGEQLKRYAESLEADWATFLGRRHDVPGLLALADLAILPSLAEGMPMSVIEAIALGVPVVATDVGDVRSVLQRTGAGLCVPPEDPVALYDACLGVLSDALVRERMSRQGRASRHFDSSTMTDRYAELFEAAGSGRPPTRVGGNPHRAEVTVDSGRATAGRSSSSYPSPVAHRPRGRPRAGVLLASDFHAKYMAGLARGLSAAGHSVTVLTRSHDLEFGGEPGALRAYMHNALDGQARHLELGGRVRDLRGMRSMVATRRMVRDAPPDVVHLQDGVFADPRLIAVAGARPGRYALTVHDPLPHPGDYPQRVRFEVVRRRLVRHAGLIFVHSEALVEELVARDRPTAPLVVVPHGVGSPEFAPLPSTPSLLFFGRMVYYKGLDTLLDSMPKVWERVPKARLTVAGAGKVEPHPVLADRRVTLRNKHVPEDELSQLFSQSSCVVLPYRQASASGVGSLAKRHGRALVVSDVGSLPELVDQASGRVVPPEDPAALSAALVEVLTVPGLAESMGRASAASVLEGWSWEQVAERTVEAYARFLGPRGSRKVARGAAS